MSDSLIGNTKKKDVQNICTACRKLIPDETPFCPYCGPPIPLEDSPDEGMGFGQAFIRILLIVIFFGAIAIFKLDISLTDNAEETSPALPGIKSPVGTGKGKPYVVDYQTINYIKVDKSLVRQKPSDKVIILTVLQKGSEVTILDGNEDWWKIRADGETGWIPKDDLGVQIR